MGGPHSVRGGLQSSLCAQHWGLSRRPSCRALGAGGPPQREAIEEWSTRGGFIGGVGGKGGGMHVGKEGLGTPGYSLEKVFRGPWGATGGVPEQWNSLNVKPGDHYSSNTHLTLMVALLVCTALH